MPKVQNNSLNMRFKSFLEIKVSDEDCDDGQFNIN